MSSKGADARLIKLGGESKSQGPAVSPIDPLVGLRAVQIGATQALPDIPWFPNDTWHLIPPYAPDAIVGTRESLRRLCQYLIAQDIDFGFVDRAVFVLTQVGERPLSDGVRDELWCAFGVPVFELFVAGDGVILAHECDAHVGWHVNETAAHFLKLRGEPHLVLRRLLPDGGRAAIGVGFTGALTRQQCACGLETQRVVRLQAAYSDADESFPLDVTPRNHAPALASAEVDQRPSQTPSAMLG